MCVCVSVCVVKGSHAVIVIVSYIGHLIFEVCREQEKKTDSNSPEGYYGPRHTDGFRTFYALGTS